MQIVGRFSELRLLDLRYADITDRGLAQLHRLGKLERILLTGTRVTQQGVDRLAAAIPNLLIESRFSSWDGMFRGDSIVHLRPRQFTERQVKHNEVHFTERPAVAHIQQLRGRYGAANGFVQNVQLDGKHVGNQDLRQLARLRNLRSLAISGTTITEAGLSRLHYQPAAAVHHAQGRRAGEPQA